MFLLIHKHQIADNAVGYKDSFAGESQMIVLLL